MIIKCDIYVSNVLISIIMLIRKVCQNGSIQESKKIKNEDFFLLFIYLLFMYIVYCNVCVRKEESRLYKCYHYSNHYGRYHCYYHLYANNLPNRC